MLLLKFCPGLAAIHDRDDLVLVLVQSSGQEHPRDRFVFGD
jgi:hypothetical protein